MNCEIVLHYKFYNNLCLDHIKGLKDMALSNIEKDGKIDLVKSQNIKLVVGDGRKVSF